MSSEKRSEAYRDRSVQALLTRFVEGQIGEITPSPDLEHGFRYPLVEEILNGGPGDSQRFLERLHGLGILERKFYDKAVACPDCESPNVTLRYHCPGCDSTNIQRKALLEHITCGCIDTEAAFQHDEAKICPRCGEPLKAEGTDFRKVGSWFECQKCGKKFEAPTPRHLCRANGHTFSIRDASLFDVYSYTLTPEADTEFRSQYIVLAPLQEVLRSRGYEVSSPGILQGESGMPITFDIVALRKEDEAKILVDVKISDKPLDEAPVISMFAKVYDTKKPATSALVIIPSLAERAKKLADLYKLTLIEARNPSEAKAKFEKLVK